ncbi:MAG: hypothetical protein GF353_20550 [Candidatus Lokiarchaeota archaeon]|nr:hypothetical protein [Candidatus Lokiarchaeota archaeon]
MNLYQEYNKLVNNYSFFEDQIEKILRIFEGTGDNQIIKSEIVPQNFSIKDFIVLSDEIERGLNLVHKGLRDIQEENAINSGYLFYFSQYGGSKTQFLNLISNEISSKLSNCITVLFEDLHHINPILIFENIFSQIFKIIARNPKFQEDTDSYRKFSQELRHKIAEVQISIRQSSNLKEAEIILENLRKIKNPNLKKEINKLDNLLHSTILVDPLLIFGKIIDLMQFCSQEGISFLFLFDEVDLWLEERGEALRFSRDFNRISKLMKYVLEVPDNKIKTFIIFACTDRVNRLFLTMQPKFENISPIASRLNRIYNSSEKVVEPGNYGSKIDEALVNIAAFYHLTNNRLKIDNNFLEQTFVILESKYSSLSRRMANSKIIQILNDYKNLKIPLEIGIKEWKNNTTFYGNLIQKNLPSILDRLTIKFVREDIAVDPSYQLTKDKIDGYFVNYSLQDEQVRTHVEIKLTSKFKGKKGYQALQFLQLHPEDPLVLIIFCPSPLEAIKKEIYEYGENNGYDKKIYERLHFIHIINPMAFAPINGITKVSSKAESLLDFLQSLANWFDFFGNFSSQYQEIKQNIGIDFGPRKTKESKEEIKEKDEGEEISIKPKLELTIEQKTCLNLISQLYHKRRFTDSGRIYKSSIRKFIEENSLGITDIEKYYELMKRSNIIESITDKTIAFSERIIKMDSLDDLMEYTISLFNRTNENSVLFNFN